MTRVHWAQRCKAHRANGEPCRSWAIAGGTVCRCHGGAAPAVRQAAARRLAEARTVRAATAILEDWLLRHGEWRDRRVAETAELLGIPQERVTLSHIAECRRVHGRPGGPETEPRPMADPRLRALDPPMPGYLLSQYMARSVQRRPVAPTGTASSANDGQPPVHSERDAQTPTGWVQSLAQTAQPPPW